jgi:hypothetical protein
MWSLSNAFASAFKELDPIPQFRATAKLGSFLEADGPTLVVRSLLGGNSTLWISPSKVSRFGARAIRGNGVVEKKGGPREEDRPSFSSDFDPRT